MMNGGAEDDCRFIKFLHGPRSRKGNRFGKAELRALVATFVANFEMKMEVPGKNVVVSGTVNSKPRDRMKLRLKDLR
jgi:cytochrome P450